MAAPCQSVSHIIFIVLIIFNACQLTVTFEPVTLSAVIAGGAVLGGISYRYGSKFICSFVADECCDSSSIRPDFEGLAAVLESELYGQHLVKQATLSALKGHYYGHQQTKALALSFHGITGSGKNHVSNLIVDKIYKKGSSSKFVHFFSATHHFPHESKINHYKEYLRKAIVSGASACERAIFIFDEMDKMPLKLIDTILPYLDYHHNLDGVDYRKTTFIFLSNAGGAEISRFALEHWKRGLNREEITLKDLQALTNVGAFNTRGGWWHSALMEKHLISAFVPFLPLERKHIKKCIVNELNKLAIHCDRKMENCDKYRPTDNLVNDIADSVSYFPKDHPQFAASGCKRIADQVFQVLFERDH